MTGILSTTGIISALECERQRLQERVERHATVFLGERRYDALTEGQDHIRSAAFSLRRILREGLYADDDSMPFESSQNGSAVVSWSGLVAGAIAYTQDEDMAQNGWLLLEGMTQMAPADIVKSPEMIEFLSTPAEKLSAEANRKIAGIKRSLGERSFSLPARPDGTTRPAEGTRSQQVCACG